MKKIVIPYGPFLEEWRDIPGYEGLYAASNYGRIKALKKNRIQPRFGGIRIYQEKIKSHHFTDRGYHQVSLSKNGKKSTYRVQRLVAFAWLPNPKNLPTTNHKDGYKDNNCEFNLEWCSQGDNNRHAKRTGLNNNFGSGHHTARLTEKDVVTIRKLSSEGVETKELANKYNLTFQQIHHIIKRKQWKHI